MTVVGEPTKKDLQFRIEELKSRIHGYEINEIMYEGDIRKLQELVDAGPLIGEEEYLREMERLKRIAVHAVERLKERGSEFRCSWCGNVARAKKMSIWWNENTGEVLFLHFRFCRHFPEPFRDTKAGERGWHRIDPWQHIKGTRPRLRKDYGYKVADAPVKQTKLQENENLVD
jgi:hypothetical protein